MEKEILQNYLSAFAEFTEKNLQEVERVSPYFTNSFMLKREEVIKNGAMELNACHSIQEVHDTLEGMYTQLTPYFG